MDIHNSQFGSEIEYDSFDLGTPAWVVKPGPAAIPAIPFVPGFVIASENFEGTLWNDVPFAFGDWEVTSSESHGGTKSFRGKTGIGKTTSTFAIYDFFGSSQVSFWYKNPGFVTGFVNDVFEVFLDGTLAFSTLNIAADWTYVAIPLNFNFEIDFVFTKNFPIIDDTDTVFLDDLILGGLDTPGVPGSPAHPLVYSPMHLCEDDRLLVSPALQAVLDVPEQIVATEDFEGVVTGSGTWTVTASSPHTGTMCLQSATITDGQTTDYTFSVPATATSIKFWERVSSESGFDFLSVYKDVVDFDHRLFQDSGTANTWNQQILDITGATQIIFRYNKDSSGSSGLDAVFIDDIEWVIPDTPAHEICAPLHTNENGELKVVILDSVISITGVPHLDCATDSVTVCQGGPISVTILNPAPTVSGALSTRPLNCSTDSVEICNDVGSPITVSGTVTANQGTSPWVVSGTVNIGTIPEVEIKNDSGNPIPVSFSRLTCATDSVEICNDAGSPITVSGTVNIGNVPHVIVDSLPEIEIKNDVGNPIPVNGTVTVNQGTNPWNIDDLTFAADKVDVSGSAITIEALSFAEDKVDVSGSTITVNQGTSPWVVSGSGVFIGTGNKTLTDAYANPTDDQDVASLVAGFNGITWDRQRSTGDNADGVAVASLGEAIVVNRNTVYNGTTWDRQRSGTALGSILVNNPTAANLKADVSGSSVTIEALTFAEDKVDISGSSVSISNIPHVIVDSIPEVEIKNDSGNPIPVSFTRLTCGTDSVEICNDVGNPITVNVTNTPHVIVDLLPAVTITGNVTINDAYSPQAVFYSTFGENAFNTAADSATGGRLWLLNTTSQLVIVREVRFTCVVTSLVDLGSALPLLQMERITFTGTPSGATITPCKRDSTDPNTIASLRTANTGMTITTGAVARKFAPPNLSVIGGLLSANTALSTPTEQIFQPQDRRLLVLRQNEGIVFRQSTAGNATEGRSFMINIMWEELP